MSTHAVMPLNDYKNICDAVREKTSTTGVIKSGELPDKITDVYEKGASDFGTVFEKAGMNLVTIRHVHPKEHDVEVLTDAESVTVLGKNLIPYPYTNMSVTHKGVTFTVNDDGTIVADGTNDGTGTSYIIITQWSNNPLSVGTYIMSGAPTSDTYMTFSGINVTCANGKSTTFTISEGQKQNMLTCSVYSGRKVENVVFKPMVEAGTQATEFEKYKNPVTYPVTDGKAIVKSVSPVMNITAPVYGDMVIAKGYLDGQAIIDELTQAIVDIGGEV